MQVTTKSKSISPKKKASKMLKELPDDCSISLIRASKNRKRNE